MKLSFNYDVLNSSVSLLTSTLRSALATQSDKYLVFRVGKERLDIHAFSASVVIKKSLPLGTFECEGIGDEEVTFQVPAMQFSNFLSQFSASDISTPLSVDIEPVSDFSVELTVSEELVEGEDTVIKSSTVRITTTRVGATIFSRLDVIRATDMDVDFSVLSEEDSLRLSVMVNNLLPYIPVNNSKMSCLSFEQDGYVKLFTSNTFVKHVNKLENFLDKAGVNAMGIALLRDILSRGQEFEFYDDKELGALVIKSDGFVIGVLYEKNLNTPKDLTKEVDFYPSIRVSRPILERYIARMKAMATNASATTVFFTISEDVSEVLISGSDVIAPLDITSHEDSEDKFLPEYEFSMSLSSLDSLLFGKPAYAEDIQFGFFSLGNTRFALVSDSSNAWNVLISV